MSKIFDLVMTKFDLVMLIHHLFNKALSKSRNAPLLMIGDSEGNELLCVDYVIHPWYGMWFVVFLALVPRWVYKMIYKPPTVASHCENFFPNELHLEFKFG